MDTITFLASFLGGGVMSVVITQLFSVRGARTERKAKLLEDQLRELYAPLFYLVAQSEKLFELNKRFHDAFKVEFIDKQYSDQPLTRERVNTWTNDTLQMANQYVNQVESNNQKINDLLNDKFSYIDSDDIETFLLFFEHHIRLATERDETGKIKTPNQIYSHIGDISYLRPEFIERVKSKFFGKKKELSKLTRK
jgi:hypothetical protein